ncbi:MAG: hypothetical protein IKY83_05965 [Proteobacteria bacterium]|nr:hypothetical protein [Pseudomonadota bacterium]
MTKGDLIACLLAGCMILGGCAQEREKTPLHEQVVPKHKVDLPDRPDFDSVLIKSAPKKDGILSTWWLVHNQQDYLDKEVRVRGVITSVSEDCPQYTAPRKRPQKGRRGASEDEETVSRKCRGLSVVIDSPENSNKLVEVVGYHPFYHPHLKPGMTLDVTGKYVLFGNDMFGGYISYRNGLILTSELHGMGVDRTGHFTTNMAEISSMIAKGELLGMRK